MVPDMGLVTSRQQLKLQAANFNTKQALCKEQRTAARPDPYMVPDMGLVTSTLDFDVQSNTHQSSTSTGEQQRTAIS
jgi:hypothetical protein